jgi:SAM-dependent methyltransferase
LVAFVAARQPGVAIDLGCGTGTQARYLAAHGWRVTAVDFVPRAVEQAARADAGSAVTWRVADVTVPSEVDPDGHLAGRCDLLLDNGCLHGLTGPQRVGWASTVRHLAAADASLLVRAAAPRRRVGIGPSGIEESVLRTILGPDWQPSATPARKGRDWYHYVLRRAAG